MINKRFGQVCLGLFFVLISNLVFPPQIKAQAPGGKGLTIIPPKFELFANPGDTVTEKIRVRNESDAPVTYAIVTEDFASSGEEGGVTLEEPGSESGYSLATWLEPDRQDLILQPLEEATLTFNINVPRDAEPGGHYASLLFSSGGTDVPGAANVTQRIGSLVLLRVSGNVDENATIETFEAPSYSQSGPISLTLRVLNQGNVHIRPKGTIVITDLFGRKVEELPLNGANVLPGAVRKMTTEWNKDNLLGRYTATLVATYGQQNLPLTAATKFTVMSPTAAVLLGIALIAAIIFIISLISGRGRLKKAFKALTSGD